MNPPPEQLPPDAAQRAADTVEWLAKFAGGLALLWAFMARVGKPFLEWRRKQLAAAVRAVLEPELAVIKAFPDREKATTEKLDMVLQRQNQLFEEIDLFTEVVADSRERLDELGALLDEVGFSSGDRRESTARRSKADEALKVLQGHLRDRRRLTGLIPRPD